MSDQSIPLRRTREIEVYGNRHATLYDDEIAAADGTPGRYLRLNFGPGVVIVPVRGNQIAFAPVFRYALNSWSLELPCGGMEPGESPEEAALRELAEETGLRADRTPDVLGVIHTDSGIIESACTVVRVHVSDEPADEPRLETFEAIRPIAWYDPDLLRDTIASGAIRCGRSLAALGLHAAHS